MNLAVSKRKTAQPLDLSSFSLRAIDAEATVLTDDGLVAAHGLTRSHRLQALGGGDIAIDWIERFDFDADFLARYPDIAPFCLEAGSLGPRLPRRDLFLSPKQMLWCTPEVDDPGRLGSAKTLAKKPTERGGAIAYIAIGTSRPTLICVEGIWVLTA